MRIKNPSQKQQKLQQGLEAGLKKLYQNMKNSLQHNIIVQQHELLDVIDMTNQHENTSRKIITIWKKLKSKYEIWWQYEYQSITKTLIMSSYFTQNYQICNINGHFNINLITSLFQRYTKELQGHKQFYQFSINPISGFVKIVNKSLVSSQQLKSQIIKPSYLDQILYNIQAMVELNTHTIKLHEYFSGRIKQCPVPDFVKHTLSNNKLEKISPKTFLKCINTSLNQVDPNCQQNIQTFGNFHNVQEFINKSEIPFPVQMVRIIQSFNPNHYHIPMYKQSPHISQVLNDIYQVSYIDQAYTQAETLAKKIRITTQFNDIQWKPLARGGFGLIEKAYVHYQLFDFGSKIGQQLQGYIVRKSDTKLPKIQHQHKIFSLLKTQYHSNIMPHYIPDQKIYQKYIFSKFQPNMSMDKYIKVNKKTISLQTIIRFMEHTVKGLLFLKEKSIVHLDIKPNNIIITKEFKAKITDFGEAYYQEDQVLQHKYGFTIPYIAPQALQQMPKLNSKVDVYAVGVTIYKVIFGNHLWGDLFDRDKFLEQIQRNKQVLILTPERILKQGMPQIIGALTNISLKCINRQQSLRPSLFYISVVLSFCRYYIYSLTEKSKSDETKK